MKRDSNGRFTKKDTIEFPIPSVTFIIKYFLMIIVLMPWIYFGIYKLNIWMLFEKALFFIFGNPYICENGKSGKKPY